MNPWSNSMAEIVSNSATCFGERPALIFEGLRWSFRELDDAVSKVAHRLRGLGLKPGDMVAIYSPNCPQWLMAYHAVMRIGGVANPLNLMLTSEEAAYALNDCGAAAVIGSFDKVGALEGRIAQTRIRHRISFAGNAPRGCHSLDDWLDGAPVSEPPASVSLDDTSTVGYTSGTTGHPKGAVLTHRAVMMNVAMTATMHVRTSSDIVVTALPCSHVYGNVVMNAALAYGMTLVLHRSFDALAVLRSIQDHRATMFEGVPTMYMYMLNTPGLSDFDLSSLTRCTVGGQTMSLAKMQQVEKAFGCRLIELWGMTELGGLGTTHSAYGPPRLGSIGVALPHMEVRIASLDEPTQPLAPGEIGELQIRGPMTMREYLGKPDATRETLIAQGWLRTGDLARVDEDGYIFVVDRLKDMIITAGFKVYPAELERAIAEHSAVAMVAVGSMKDEAKGELAKAYVVVKAGAALDAAALEQHCRERLAAYKVPRIFQFVADLPKTSSGKVLRRQLHTLDGV